jgi:hypothetical protein
LREIEKWSRWVNQSSLSQTQAYFSKTLLSIPIHIGSADERAQKRRSLAAMEGACRDVVTRLPALLDLWESSESICLWFLVENHLDSATSLETPKGTPRSGVIISAQDVDIALQRRCLLEALESMVR